MNTHKITEAVSDSKTKLFRNAMWYSLFFKI